MSTRRTVDVVRLFTLKSRGRLYEIGSSGDVCRRFWADDGETGNYRLIFAMGKIRGTPCMRSHTSAYRATTKYFSNPFVFKTRIEKEELPRDIPPDLGAGGPRFKSGRPDQNISRILFKLSETLFTPNFPVEFCQTGGLNSQVV